MLETGSLKHLQVGWGIRIEHAEHFK